MLMKRTVGSACRQENNASLLLGGQRGNSTLSAAEPTCHGRPNSNGRVITEYVRQTRLMTRRDPNRFGESE